jgi:bacterial/archaeal transporter family protein
MNRLNASNLHALTSSDALIIEPPLPNLKCVNSQNERMNRKTRSSARQAHCATRLAADILGPVTANSPPAPTPIRSARFPRWLLWSIVTIVLWGTWGLVSKIASEGVDAYANQLLYTAGLAPLLVFVAFTVYKQNTDESRKRRLQGIFWAFLTGILGGGGNIFFFQALVKGGKASIVAPVTALFPMVTVLLALLFLKERLGRLQWIGLILAFAAIYLLSI